MIFFSHSLLVFCQRQSNQRLVLFMVLAFYFESSLGTFLFLILQEVGANEGAYWISTAHPISRIPVFFMGVCAGVLCMRIKEQDYEALNCKELVIFKNTSIYVILLKYFKNSHTNSFPFYMNEK